MRYIVKCDTCKATMSETGSLRESAEGGECDGCRLDRCAPEFKRAIRLVAESTGQTDVQVFETWRKYSRECDNAGQSATLPEFYRWYFPTLAK